MKWWFAFNNSYVGPFWVILGCLLALFVAGALIYGMWSVLNG